ncbi:hypothetical protein CEXT_496711 [Caerostris extrusa]|uniref:Uncharacterized protein n=1 Tax=Caerostris extrusa TaxID=172846 RepID=A0AAV4VJS3_CAEEX|nr:hypothetical protein CEXT_496711 [Caerostris extrusa]
MSKYLSYFRKALSLTKVSQTWSYEGESSTCPVLVTFRSRKKKKKERFVFSVKFENSQELDIWKWKSGGCWRNLSCHSVSRRAQWDSTNSAVCSRLVGGSLLLLAAIPIHFCFLFADRNFRNSVE